LPQDLLVINVRFICNCNPGRIDHDNVEDSNCKDDRQLKVTMWPAIPEVLAYISKGMAYSIRTSKPNKKPGIFDNGEFEQCFKRLL